MTLSNLGPIGFLGAGKMATALAAGWIAADCVTPAQITACDPVGGARDAFRGATGAEVGTDNRGLVESSSIVVLAVKPQVARGVLEEISGLLTNRHLLISIVAGIKLEQLRSLTNSTVRLVRIMPNTPCLVGTSAAGYSPGPNATQEDVQVIDRLMNVVGKAFAVPEHLLDAVTGLSGSGPAYVYAMIEALSDGGVRVGLPRDIATTLAAQTVLGAAKMVLETGLHTGQLKDMVASPGGTTIAGLHALELGGVRGALMNAVQAATERSQQLGQG
ncbi:MAG: pyrroline-5-carboxylate reductase [Gemmataceae bacterium]